MSLYYGVNRYYEGVVYSEMYIARYYGFFRDAFSAQDWFADFIKSKNGQKEIFFAFMKEVLSAVDMDKAIRRMLIAKGIEVFSKESCMVLKGMPSKPRQILFKEMDFAVPMYDDGDISNQSHTQPLEKMKLVANDWKFPEGSDFSFSVSISMEGINRCLAPLTEKFSLANLPLVS